MSSRIIYILESPSADDFLMDRNEVRTLTRLLELAEIRTIPITVVDGMSLTKTITAIVELIKTEAHQPIIHFSTHGDKSGIALTGKFIKWKALRDELAPIAKATGSKMLVCMSACFGIKAIHMIQIIAQVCF